MKLTSGIVFVFSVYFGTVGSQLFFVVAALSMLFFLLGVENSVIENTTEYVRKAIAEDKSYNELEKERLAGEG